MIALLLMLASVDPAVHRREEPVDPYEMHDANAGAAPFHDPHLLAAFHGRDGIARIANSFVDLATTDKRISDIFQGQDIVRLRRTVNEQFCYILGGGCAYTGRDMKAAHKDLGIQTADFNAIVEDLQKAMRTEGVPFRMQNRFLAKLAPMKRDTVER
jgi:hemoglobin